MIFGWKPYVSVAKRRQKAERAAAKFKKAGQALSPVSVGRGTLAKTFWGKAWCRNLERYSDYSNRLPRGRTYLRNGSVIDLTIAPGEVAAQVMGSSLYHIQVNVMAVPAPQWQGIARDCAQSIDSLVELLQGQMSSSVMERITRPGTGLFPAPKEISFRCSCPDAALMCKHVAATLYGIGARLDAEPELLFSLRRVDAKDLIAHAGESAGPSRKAPDAARILASSKLADIFGIDISGQEQAAASEVRVSAPARKASPPSKKPRASKREETKAR